MSAVAQSTVEQTDAQEAEKESRYKQVETGIYRYVDAEGKSTYHERPWIDGKRKWRSLGVNFTPQSNLKNARDEYHRRRTEVAAGRDPYATATKAVPVKARTMKDVIFRYIEDGCPDKHRRPRSGQNLADEEAHCERLLSHWHEVLIDNAGPAECDKYHDWRVGLGAKDGNRMVDREMNTLNNACRWGVRCRIITANPLADRPKYQASDEIHHCREFMPRTTDELHDAARLLFAHPHSVVLGFQMLDEACSGLRTNEVLKWGTDIFGTTTEDGANVHVWRLKGQHANNPYVANHEGLKAVLAAHMAWLAANYPEGTESWFPSHTGGSIGDTALAHALRRLWKSKMLRRRLKSHGMRALYVLIRRSQGAKDEIIADEIGHSSNGACIKSTYGGVPDSWRNGGGPNMKWLSTSVPVAWAELEKNGWKAEYPPSSLKGKKRQCKA